MTAKPLRICHLAYTFYEEDNRVIRYAEFLAEQGADVDVIALRSPRRPSRESLRGVRVLRIQRRSENEKRPRHYLFKLGLFFVRATLLLTALHVRRRYDVVHVHNVPDFLVFAAVVPKLLGARILLDVHDIVPEFYMSKFSVPREAFPVRLLFFIERLACRFADHVIVANHLWHEKLTSRSVGPEKCTALMNYPDYRFFAHYAKNQRNGHDGYKVLYPGSLNRHQGLDIAIRAFARIRDRIPGAEFCIYGSGPTRNELGALAESLGVSDIVKFEPSISIDEISSVIAGADLGLVPKRAEGFGNEAFSTKILEFMASGVPVIVSRTRVDSYYFDDSIVTFFASGDDVDLSEKLVWMYEHRAENGERIEKAHAFAEKHSWVSRSEEYARIVSRTG